ncbi:MAG: tRNA (guanosine(46)-N7)-methyltransferase TrmB [Candidatus Gracilibacteria bacterium]
MGRQKQKHFEEMKAWEHVFEPDIKQGADVIDLKGTWGKKVILELACGGGDYTVALAKALPDATVVGVDIKGSRMWIGAKIAHDSGVLNAKFLRTRIENLADFFAEGEVDEIWITFPNPHPTKGNEKRRLTSPRFLEMYSRLLKRGGFLHLKTDSEELFNYSSGAMRTCGFKIVKVIDDVYACQDCDDFVRGIQTCYEKKYLDGGRKIRYVKAESLLA